MGAQQDFRNNQPPRYHANRSSCTFAPNTPGSTERSKSNPEADIRPARAERHKYKTSKAAGADAYSNVQDGPFTRNINPATKTIVPIPLGQRNDTGSWSCRRAGGSSFPNGQDAGFFFFLDEGLMSCKGPKGGCSGCILRTGPKIRDETRRDESLEMQCGKAGI